MKSTININKCDSIYNSARRIEYGQRNPFFDSEYSQLHIKTHIILQKFQGRLTIRKYKIYSEYAFGVFLFYSDSF